ncbi:MAG: hypothetical protein IT223_01895 [Crocinitomicaceae bacterium]|nr:hypothetical protein [Crocinitomicaceae bacterium]
MDKVHLHLLINHLPIFSSIIGAFVLAVGIIAKSKTTRMTSYILLIGATLGAIITNNTGESAEDKLEDQPGYSHELIHEHEEAAEACLPFFFATGLTAAVLFYLDKKDKKIARPLSFVLLALSITAFALAARAGYLGGYIKHNEIRPAEMRAE